MRLIDLQIINEDLGNLQKLQIGPMINVLKQHGSTSRSGRDEPYISPVGSKFAQREIGPNSEIIDASVIKNGIKGLRKAYKDNPDARAFAIYIGSKAVMFGTFEAETLAGSSRSARLAYDFSQYKDLWDQVFTSTWDRPATTTARSVEPRSYEKDDAEKQGKVAKPAIYAGNMVSTGELSKIFDVVEMISKTTSQPVTARLVMPDIQSRETRITRYQQADINKGVEDLKTRLAKFKLAKQPTVDTIEQFIEMTMKNPGKVVQFAGRTYYLKGSSYDKLDPTSLLSGKPFTTRYNCADPGAYDSLELTYAFDPATSMLKPVNAIWYDRTIPNDRASRQEAVLDGPMYLRSRFKGLKDLSDKKVIMPKLLTMVKDQRYQDAKNIIDALRKSDQDWPELAMIEKSLAAMKKDR